MCPGSGDPFYIVSYHIKWVTTSWTHSIYIQSGYQDHRADPTNLGAGSMYGFIHSKDEDSNSDPVKIASDIQ